jgi:hypothetical protein
VGETWVTCGSIGSQVSPGAWRISKKIVAKYFSICKKRYLLSPPVLSDYLGRELGAIRHLRIVRIGCELTAWNGVFRVALGLYSSDKVGFLDFNCWLFDA